MKQKVSFNSLKLKPILFFDHANLKLDKIEYQKIKVVESESKFMTKEYCMLNFN